ncbi:MAG: hypothetical protein ABWZ57_14110, partial [Mesorhizobium sp.]
MNAAAKPELTKDMLARCLGALLAAPDEAEPSPELAGIGDAFEARLSNVDLQQLGTRLRGPVQDFLEVLASSPSPDAIGRASDAMMEQLREAGLITSEELEALREGATA